MITSLVGVVRRHQLVAFFALAYLLSWWAWFWYLLQRDVVDAPLLPFGPFLAALVMLALVGGVLYLLGRARTALRGRGPRQLR